MNHAASAPAWMCAWSIWAFSAVMITSVAEHTHAGTSVAEHTHAGASGSQGEATRTINLGDRWSVNNAVQRGEGKREITTANWEKKNRLLKMEGNQSHYVPGTLSSKKKKKNTHFWDFPYSFLLKSYIQEWNIYNGLTVYCRDLDLQSKSNNCWGN